MEGARASLTESTSENEVAPSPQSSGIPRIMVDIRMTNGIHIQQRNLSYDGLKRLVEKLEALC